MSRLAAVVLAAGASTRMGAPKAMLVWRGHPFLTHVIALARVAGATPVVVVEGAHALPSELLVDVLRVKNDAWEQGPLGSLQTGLRLATKDAPSGVLVLSVDRPHVAASTIEALVLAHERAPMAVLQPLCEGRHGHPIVWPLDLAQRVLALRIDATPRDVLGAPDVASRREFVHVADKAVLDNIDTPDDLERLYAARS